MRWASISSWFQRCALCRCKALETSGLRLSHTGGRAWAKAFEWQALGVLLCNAGQQAQLAGQGPEDHGRLDAFATQAFEHVQGMAGVAVQAGVDQAEYVVAGAVGYRGLDRLGVDLPAFGQQLELFDLLGSGEEVALDARRDHFDRFLVSGQAGLCQALTDPLGQLRGVDRPDLHELHILAVDQRLGPLGLCVLPSSFGRLISSTVSSAGRAR